MTSTRSWRRRVLVGLVFVVAAAVLVGSWRAAMNAAADGGRPMPWLWPVSLEAFIFVLVLVYWDARAEGRRARGIRALLALTTGVACTVQVLDAPASWLGWLTAAWTPVALLLSIEVATWLLYGTRARPDWPPPPLPPDPDPQDEPEPVPADAPVRTRRQRALTSAELVKVAPLITEGRTPHFIHKQLGIPYPVVRQHMRDQELVATNGDRSGS
jgi:hypothetical protein